MGRRPLFKSPDIDALYGLFTDNLACTPERWWADLRNDGFIHFTETGFPTAAHEEWKYTDLSTLASESFHLPDEEPQIVDAQRLAALWPDRSSAAVLVVHNGRLVAEQSQFPMGHGIIAKSLNEAIHENVETVRNLMGRMDDRKNRPMAALNAAFAKDGVFLYVPKDHEVSRPIHILHLHTNHDDGALLSSPRHLFVLEDGAKARIVEHWENDRGNGFFANAVTEIQLKNGAELIHTKIENQAENAKQVAAIHADLAPYARYDQYSIAIGKGLLRNDIDVRLNGEEAQTNLFGLYAGENQRHVDHHTRVDHAKPGAKSSELYKGIMDGDSRGVFNGKIIVHKDAQRTEAYQKNQNLLLSTGARVDTKPQLEIFADDVRCSHGATVGNLDDRALFYLRSRGIAQSEARRMLTRAFAEEIIHGIPEEAAPERIATILFGKTDDISQRRTP